MSRPPATPEPEIPVPPPELQDDALLRALFAGVNAAQRHTTRTRITPEVALHGDAIAAMGRLHDAILSGDVTRATEALECGAWTDLEFASFSPDGEARFAHLTLLSLATLVDCQMQTLRMLPLLLEYGADIAQLDSSGRTLLHFAADILVARWLLEHGVNPDVSEDTDDSLHVLPEEAVTALAAFRLGIAVPEADTTPKLPPRL
jgi:hypothetical protein